jgi:arylsulfatase A-like enzyme
MLTASLVDSAPGASLSRTSNASLRPQLGLERHDLANLPNILLIVADDQTASTFSKRLMPTVFSELVNEGVRFNRAYAETPLCCPSRSEILTGLYGTHNGVDSNYRILRRPTIAQALHDLGYRTSMAGKYLNSQSCDPIPEFDQWVCSSRPPATGYSLVNPILDVNGELISFPGGYTASDGKPLYMQRGPLTTEEMNSMDYWYTKMSRAVRCLDGAVATVLRSLGSREQDTVVLYISDNGYLYGEHRRTHKIVPYEEAVRVPLLVRYPALVPVGEPFETGALVENVDIAATIAELAGIPWGADGKSLLPLLTKQKTSIRSQLLLEYCQAGGDPCPDEDVQRPVTPYLGVETPGWVYLEYATGEKELYDLSQDPNELSNHADDPLYASTQSSLAARLAWLKQAPKVDTTIVTGPSDQVAQGSAITFTFFSQSRFATYECRLDTNGVMGTWGPCGNQTTTYTGLAMASYVFNVRGTDEFGTKDGTPATRAFTLVP